MGPFFQQNTTSHISSTPEQLATMSDSSLSSPTHVHDDDGRSSINSDEAQLRAFGYKQVLHRSWGQAENICASFCALYFVGGIRYVFSVGIAAGGAPSLSAARSTSGLLSVAARSGDVWPASSWPFGPPPHGHLSWPVSTPVP